MPQCFPFLLTAQPVDCGKIAAMTSTPKRRYWRFHLLTALLMMVISGVVLGANVRAPRVVRIHPRNSSMHYYDLAAGPDSGMTEVAPPISYDVMSCGWPYSEQMTFTIMVSGAADVPLDSARVQLVEDVRTFNELRPGGLYFPWRVAAIDFGVWIVMLILTATVSEWFMRRRA